MRRMIIPLAAAFAMAALCFGPALGADKNQPTVSPDLRRAMNAANALVGHLDEPAVAAVALEAVASHPDFGRLGADERATWLLRAAQLAVDGGDPARALPLARASVAASPTDIDAVYLLAQLAANSGDYIGSAAALTRLIEDWPEYTAQLPYGLVNPLLYHLGVGAAAGDLLSALHAAAWSPDGVPADHAWARLALIRAQAGDLAGAREVVASIRAPGIISWMRTDRRFDAVVDRADPRLEPAVAATAWVHHLEAQVAGAPGSLPLHSELGSALLVAGRPREALALAEAALAAPDRFDDSGELHWMHNVRAVAFRRLDRSEDALAALTAGASLDESGQPNVSQTLNLGTLLVDMQRPEAALAAVARVDGMSGYGALVQATVRMRAHLQLGQPDDAAVWFERLRDGARDGPVLLLDALLWNGRMDDAARQLAMMLDDSDRRADALEWSQDHLASPPLPGRVPLVEARRALLARDDVRRAVGAVGRIERSGIHATVGID